MNFLITESQLKVLVESEKSSTLTSNMKELHSFTVGVVNKVKKKFGLNVKFLVTWGTAIGGLIAPLDRYIRENKLELSDESIALILIGVAFTFFYQNKRGFDRIIEKIEEEGLTEYFRNTLSKAEELKNEFINFLESLNLTLGSTVEMIHYSFILPIIGDLINIAHHSKDAWSTAELVVERLLASGVVLISGQILVDVINKIIKRFKNI